MRVILTENLEGVGQKGEIVNVSDGYGRNYLIPKGYAVLATEANLKRLEHVLKEREKKRDRLLKHSQEVKKSLEENVVTIYKKVGKDGKLFGSVTQKDISEAIKKLLNITIDKKQINLKEPIKSEGLHTVLIQLGHGTEANLRVMVEKKE